MKQIEVFTLTIAIGAQPAVHIATDATARQACATSAEPMPGNQNQTSIMNLVYDFELIKQ